MLIIGNTSGVLAWVLQGSSVTFLHYFSVRPPKKSWKKIFNLSGGEKTLSSLALVFALHHFKPTPLYFMDEIDAALDFKNVSIVAFYIYVSKSLEIVLFLAIRIFILPKLLKSAFMNYPLSHVNHVTITAHKLYGIIFAYYIIYLSFSF